MQILWVIQSIFAILPFNFLTFETLFLKNTLNTYYSTQYLKKKHMQQNNWVNFVKFYTENNFLLYKKSLFKCKMVKEKN